MINNTKIMKKPILILSFIALFIAAPAMAQLPLSPMPQSVVTTGDNISKSSLGKLVVKGKISPRIVRELEKALNKGESLPGNGSLRVEFKMVKAEKEYLSRFNHALKPWQLDESYLLSVGKKKITVKATTEKGLFYASRTLLQLFDSGDMIPGAEIADYPDFPVRAWQDDISRGPIPTMDNLRQQIRTMADFKLNMFTLYTEHVFRYKSHPFAPADGITPEQIRELREYAAQYHIELMANQQAFGHFEKILSQPEYRHLAENASVLNPALPETYRLLDDLLRENYAAYQSEYFHLGCDETFGLGEGPAKQMLPGLTPAEMYALHINRLDSLVRPLPTTPVIWSDIILNHPEMIKTLPQRMVYVAWAYHAAESFSDYLKPLTESGLKFWVASGAGCWLNVYPDLGEAAVNIWVLIRDGYKAGASGVLNTTWDDEGSDLMNHNWLPLAWGGELSWKKPDDEGMIKRYNTFCKAFDTHFFGYSSAPFISPSALMNELASYHKSGVRNLMKFENFYSTIFPIFPEDVSAVTDSLNRLKKRELVQLQEKIEKMGTLVTRHSDVPELMLFASKQAMFILDKNMLRIAVHNWITRGTGNETSIQLEALRLAEVSRELKSEYDKWWLNEARPFWLENINARYDKLSNDLEELGNNIIITPSPTLKNGKRAITMKALLGKKPIYFTTDGSEPTEKSQKYTDTLWFDQSAAIRAKTIIPKHTTPVSSLNLTWHKGIGNISKLHSAPSNYHPAYVAGGEQALADGITGENSTIWSGDWQGYSGQDILVDFDLKKAEPLHRLSVRFFQNTPIWVMLPKAVEVYRSADGEKWEKFAETGHNIDPDQHRDLTHLFTVDLTGLQTRYLRIKAVYPGPLPEWHPSAGQEAMMFADEIIIE